MSRKRLIENALERVLPSKLRSKFDHIEDIWNLKEGGVFLHFTYHGDSAKEAARIIEQHVEDQKLRSYYNLRPIRAFQVKGKPFIEDLLGRRPTPELSVEFDGPDVSTEVLYRLFRVYGQILDIRRNPPVKDVRNSVRIQYRSVRGATAAKNSLAAHVGLGHGAPADHDSPPARSHWSAQLYHL
ncbi:hypothetical protein CAUPRSCDRAFT_12853 [Caulochytrium protostelioides]|uniref:Mitochondrial escape protein 2 n=1 Tax=Caulochytrium protostelioides TaxID=1555241 RepID=A0A4P9WVM0_9FUNG|nr:hypothetical protein CAUPRSCDRAFT_12853 [Caulochytrium protostelioides]